jgi:putative hydrolase of the HAD superfamily
MTPTIEAIFIDLGNTLRMLVKDQDHMARARQEIVRLVGTDIDPVAFCAQLDERYKAYRKWALENLTEAPESELWTRWLVPEFPPEKIAPLGGELTFQFRQSMGRRVVVENGKEVVVELFRRGYTLGIISNLIGCREIPEWLDADGFSPYFKSVVLSSVFGKRKPDPSIYIEATRRAGVELCLRWRQPEAGCDRRALCRVRHGDDHDLGRGIVQRGNHGCQPAGCNHSRIQTTPGNFPRSQPGHPEVGTAGDWRPDVQKSTTPGSLCHGSGSQGIV